MRYEVVVEKTKHGRKTETQYCLFDNLEGRVIVRYADKKEADALLLRYRKASLSD